ncbi:unnamed protein product [Caenorhabditis brenneri]
MDSRFPFFRLPLTAGSNVLKNMDISEKLAFSLLSKRAKLVIRLLKLRPHYVRVNVGGLIGFEINFDDSNQTVHLQFCTNTVLDIPKGITVNETESWRLPSSKMTMKDWLRHLRFIFRTTYITCFNFGFGLFDFDSIKKSFAPFEMLFISENVPTNQSIMLLKELLPRDLVLKPNSFEKHELRSILTQHIECFSYGRHEEPSDFALNDLLICDAVFLNIIWPLDFTETHMNRFLKLWKKGACPRLCMLEFSWVFVRNAENILKGINFEEVSEDRVINWLIHGERMSIKGGYDIGGKDGRKCTVVVPSPFEVSFYFWD